MKPRLVMLFQKRQKKKSHRVQAQIVGEVSDLDPSMRAAVVGMGHNSLPQRQRVALIPEPQFLRDGGIVDTPG